MKVDLDKDWCMKMAAREAEAGDPDCSAGCAGCENCTDDPALAGAVNKAWSRFEAEMGRMEWIDKVVQDVAELDYNSPEGQPDVMLVKANELRAILESAHACRECAIQPCDTCPDRPPARGMDAAEWQELFRLRARVRTMELALTAKNAAETNALKAAQEADELRAALESVRQYGSDTLSGRIDGPDDLDWQRAAVLEMTRRARLALGPNV